MGRSGWVAMLDLPAWRVEETRRCVMEGRLVLERYLGKSQVVLVNRVVLDYVIPVAATGGDGCCGGRRLCR